MIPSFPNEPLMPYASRSIDSHGLPIMTLDSTPGGEDILQQAVYRPSKYELAVQKKKSAEQKQQQQPRRILNAWSANGNSALSAPLPTALPAIAPNQSRGDTIEALRAENYEYKTGTDAEGRLITNRPELDEDYDPDEWMPAAKYDPTQLQSAKLNPDLSDWDKRLWMVQKGKPLRAGRQMMVRKPKELLVAKSSIDLPTRPVPQQQEHAFQRGSIAKKFRIFDRLDRLYSNFEAAVSPMAMAAAARIGDHALTETQRMRRNVLEKNPSAIEAFKEWQDIQNKIGVLLVQLDAFGLFREHPTVLDRVEICMAFMNGWDRLDARQKKFMDDIQEREEGEYHGQQQQQPEAATVESKQATNDRFYADCTRIDLKVVTLPGMVMERNLDGSTKLLTADEYYLKDCWETEEEWYRRFMKQNPKATPLAAKKHLLDLRCRYIPPEKTLVFQIPGLEEYERQQKKKQQAVTEAPFQDSMAPASAPPSPKSESQHGSE
jgi:hypothetical protein